MHACVCVCMVHGKGLDVILFIEDVIGVHKLGNNSHERDAITLHLYSPPIRELTLFEPEKKLVSKRRPGFYSIGGKKT